MKMFRYKELHSWISQVRKSSVDSSAKASELTKGLVANKGHLWEVMELLIGRAQYKEAESQGMPSKFILEL